jgi:predicted flap endonuclease-1-like 5' DNA nuclease
MAYPITDIQGIGPDAAAVLKSGGIRTTVGLLRLAEQIGTDKRRVLDWVTAADRMRVKGVGWEYAQLLHAAGVNTVNELRYRNPQKLVCEMAEANGRRKLVSVLPSVRMVQRWIDSAKKLTPAIRY